MLCCPRCQRPNPSEAVFCHFDGAELRPVFGTADPLRHTRLASPFVFPTGRSCGTYDELAQACQDNWESASDLLHKGIFGQYLASIGRMDLARAAQEAQGEKDSDLALDTFLGRLPVAARQGPRLDLKPRRWVLGMLKSGDTCDLLLTVLNQGRGLLHGTVRVEEGTSWLRVGEGISNGECRLRTADQQAVVVEVDTRGLPAPHTYSTRLTVITNGGAAEVPVRIDLAVQPFARAPFQGVSSPRELAERMRAQPKPAVPLLESGEIASWFTSNGWTYPVQGRTAKGVAAVQQFFEGMGLSKPPLVQLSHTDFNITCSGATVLHEATLSTSARKWVYAEVESDAPWLKATPPSVSGPQQAVIGFEVDGAQLPPGSTQEGALHITANAGQTLTVRVRAATTQAAVASAIRGRLRPLLTGTLCGLLARLLLVIPGDIYARWMAATPADPAFVKHFVLATWWIGALLGLVLLGRRGSHRSDAIWGVIAGSAAGLAGSATVACLLPILDGLPRWMAGVIVPAGLPPWLGALTGVLLALVWWTLLGAAVGSLVVRAGGTGVRVVTTLQVGLAKLCGWCGWKWLAETLAAG